MTNQGAHLDAATLAHRARTAGPWTTDHLVGLVAGNATGLVLVFVGWWLTSGQSIAASQIGRLNLGLLGLVVAGAANGLWLARGYRALVLARSVVFATELESDDPSVRAATSAAGASWGDGPVAVVAGVKMTRYHRPDCQLVTGKEVTPRSPAAHERAGRRPCEVCQP